MFLKPCAESLSHATIYRIQVLLYPFSCLKAQWLLYVPSTFILNNFAFLPTQCMFHVFPKITAENVFFWCGTSWIFLYYLLWCRISSNVSWLRRLVADLLNAKVQVLSQVIPCVFCGEQCDTAIGFFFSRYFGLSLSVSFHQCSILVFTYVLHLPRSLGTFQIARLFRMSGAWDRKLIMVAVFVTSFAIFFT